MPLQPVSAVATIQLSGAALGVHQYQDAVKRYHVFASFRPWLLSQGYLAPAERPVDLVQTVLLLLGTASLGLIVMTIFAKACAAGPSWPGAWAPAGVLVNGKATLG